MINIWWVILVFGLVLVGVLVGFVLLWRKRRSEHYERNLRLVVLRLDLPPLSEDVNNTNRDFRDIVDENIAQAQVLYNILASTSQKPSLKTSYYGQRHFGFEIVAQKGMVNFYVVAPKELVPIIKQAVLSAYTSAKIQECQDHNIFSAHGGLSGVVGGQLKLRAPSAYPIATYVDSKQDIMKSILNAVSDLGEEESVAIQILLRPAEGGWTKASSSLVSAKKKGQDSSTKADFVKDLARAAVKATEEANDHQLSGTDQALIEAIEKKTQEPGFETSIRLVATSSQAMRSQAIYRNILAAFAIFDNPSSNGFVGQKVNLAKLVTAFNLRSFPLKDKDLILNTTELASIFHLPDQRNTPTTQLERQVSKQVDGPRNLPTDGLVLGHNVFRGERRQVALRLKDRMRHMYVVGQTGVGKSVFLENLAAQDMRAGNGFAFVDPHGETAEALLAQVPRERLDDVIYFNPSNTVFPMGLNIFEAQSADEQDFLIQEAMNMLYKLYDPQQQGIIGPRYEYMFRNAAKLIMADPRGGTFIDIPKLFNDRQYVESKLAHVSDQTVIDFWQKELPGSERSSEFGEVKSWFVSKFSAFLGNAMMRNIIGQTASSFNLRQVMDEGKIMIINLSKGRTGELNTKLLGMLLVTKFQMAAMSRADVDPSQRREFTLYVDEFQNFATDSFASILSEARKYRLGLIVANQFTTQLSDNIREAVFGNVGTAISFMVSAGDAEHMVKQFYNPVFDLNDLTRLPVGNVAVRTLIDGVPTPPFSMVTLPPQNEDYQLSAQVQDYLIQKFGRPRDQVESEIFTRLGSPIAQSTPPQGESSFFETWMDKRQSN